MVLRSILCPPRTLANAKEVLATQAISNVVKSSFGPSGLDKMMVDDIGVGERSSWNEVTRADSSRMSQ